MTGIEILTKAVGILFSPKKEGGKITTPRNFHFYFILHFSFLHFTLFSSALQLPLPSVEKSNEESRKKE